VFGLPFLEVDPEWKSKCDYVNSDTQRPQRILRWSVITGRNVDVARFDDAPVVVLIQKPAEHE
jgi:hypothetical protein